MKRNIFAPTDFGEDALMVQVSEMLVVTADHSDEMLDGAIGEARRPPRAAGRGARPDWQLKPK